MSIILYNSSNVNKNVKIFFLKLILRVVISSLLIQ
nr:MAG TPA: hypothetical protein [Caudoviricetes sp.]